MGNKTGKTDEEAINKNERIRKAIEMRIKGFSLEEVASDLGWNSPQAAHKALKAALEKAVIDDARTYKLIQIQRIEKAVAAVLEKAEKGNLFAVRELVRLSKRLSEIVGSDAPAKFAHEGKDGGPMKIIVEYADDPADTA